ncbi:uncharacterized protein [Anas acuta]|uniref:uncharacterized protein isoform X1 n=1 Tax=Anas acuta TaxID=28680 RepID=UPI0035C8EDED
MLAHTPWTKLFPSGPAILLLALCASMTTQDLCRSPGDLPAPALLLNTFSAQEGQMVLVQCAIDGRSPVTRIVFCKDEVETSSLKAIQGQLTYNMILNVSLGSAGKYTCGYQLKDQSNQVKNSALSVPQDLAVTGSAPKSPAQPSSPAPHARIPHALPTGTALAVAAVGLVLLAAGSWFAIRKGACRGRCPRQQHVNSPLTEEASNSDIQYSTIAHVRRDRVSLGTALMPLVMFSWASERRCFAELFFQQESLCLQFLNVCGSFLHSCSLVHAHCAGLTDSS